MARRKSSKTTRQSVLSVFILILLASVISAYNSCKESHQSEQTAALTESAVSSEKQKEASTPSETAPSVSADGLEIPTGNPDVPSQILIREGYTVSYNKETKLPNWVAWHLTAERLKGKASRKSVEFEADPDVPSPKADDSDYYNSGYDRGHICPAADNKMSIDAMKQSFLFTNICPQAPNLNRGDWNEMEIACRNWAKEYGEIYIVSGPILYKGNHKTIGKHKVTVPEAFFKVVLRLGNDPKAIGFIYKNEDGNRPKGDYVNTVDQVERITGIDFFPLLPDDIEAKVEAETDINDW